MGREQRQFIQMIAALTMLIDHIGMVFFPSAIGFRAIGRLSFPLFAFGIAEDKATLSLDSSGESLHRRGYRPRRCGTMTPVPGWKAST